MDFDKEAIRRRAQDSREDTDFLIQQVDHWRKDSAAWQDRAITAEWNLAKGIEVETELLKAEKHRLTIERDDWKARAIDKGWTEDWAFRQFKREGVNE